jgi:hypothetical protein
MGMEGITIIITPGPYEEIILTASFSVVYDFFYGLG